MNSYDLKQSIRKKYSDIANSSDSDFLNNPKKISESIGYSRNEIVSAPPGSNLGLGCGNPQALASINSGDIVIDLGSGAGFDVFIASHSVGNKGKVIGIDMLPEMINKSLEYAKKENYKNVEFILGEIENLPIPDDTADILISNCVINLSDNKQKVYDEIYRVLKKGGRISISDTIMINNLPNGIKNNPDMHSC